MAMYLVLAKYSPTGAAGVLADGVASRPAIAAKVTEAAGGKLHAWYSLADGDWHIAMIMERPDTYSSADDAHTMLFATSTGAYEAWRVMRIAEAGAVDEARQAAQAAVQAFRAPGSAS
jgi:uncharacterized protein with GYD domain